MEKPRYEPLIQVWDSFMGSGKSSLAIRQINNEPERRYIVIVKYIEEADRIVQECKSANIVQPIEKNGSKQAHFHELLRDGRSMVITHKLYSQLSIKSRERDLIRHYGYMLYMDEAAEVVEMLPLNDYDRNEILDRYVSVGENGKLQWMVEDYDYKGNHGRIKQKIESGAVIYYKNKMFMWLLPIELLRAFDHVVVMTFMFEASHMKAYLDIHHMRYETWHIHDRELVKGRQDMTSIVRELRQKIAVYDGKLNECGNGYYTLSYNWNRKAKKADKERIERDGLNYLKNKHSAKANEAQWTSYKGTDKYGDAKDENPKLCGNYASSFVPFNCVATNKHGERRHLAYLVNPFENPVIKMWYRDQGVSLNDEAFALSSLLQWIWRSAIRNGKDVTIYIPSERMRGLLNAFLETGSYQGHTLCEAA